jgi:hypothetical protein
VLIVYDEYDPEQKDGKNFVVVQTFKRSKSKDFFSILYRLYPSLHELTAITGNGDCKQPLAVTDEGTVIIVQ